MIETLEKLRNSTDPSLLSTPTDTLVLRTFGGAYQGEVLRVSGAKCTIGSSPHCTLRLLTPGVRPIHCSILRGPRGTIVRSWDAETQLNGRDFTDAMLKPADRLRCGPIEFEVVAGARPTLGFHAQDFRRVSVTLPVLPNTAPATELSVSEPSRGLDHLQTSRELLRRRLRRVLSQWRSSRSEFARLQADARLNENVGHDLHQRIADLEAQLTDYRDQLSDRDHNLARANAECLSLLDQVENLSTCNRDLTLSLENRSKQWSEERHDLNIRLDAALQEIEHTKDVRQQMLSAENLAAQTHAQCASLSEQLQQLHQQHCESLRLLEEAQQAKLGLQSSLDVAELRLSEQNSHDPTSAALVETNSADAEELAQWRLKVETAERNSANSLEAMQTLQSQLDQLQVQFEAATQKANELDELRQQLEARLVEAVANSTQPTERTASSENSRELDELNSTLAALRNQNDGLRDQIMDLTRSNDLATEQLRDAESSRQQLESLVNDLSAQLVATVPPATPADTQGFSTDNAELNIELTQWKQRAAELQARLDQFEQSSVTDTASAYSANSFLLTRPTTDALTGEATDEVAPQSNYPEGTQNRSDASSEEEERKTPRDESELFQSPLLASLLRSNSLATPVSEPEMQVANTTEVPIQDIPPEPYNELQQGLPYVANFRDVDSITPEAELVAEEPTYSLSNFPADCTQEEETQKVEITPPALSSSGLRTAAFLKQQEDDADEIDNHPVAPKHVQQATSNSNHRSAASNEEESIEDYMARLLSRMRSDSPSKGVNDKPAETVVKTPAAPSAAVAAELQNEQTDAAPKKPQYVPRTVPAEFKANLSAMREIANTTARSAIETHHKRSTKESSRAKLFGAMIAMSASIATLYYAVQNSAGKQALWQFAMVFVGFAVAGYWTLQSMRMSRRVEGAVKNDTESPGKQLDATEIESSEATATKRS